MYVTSIAVATIEADEAVTSSDFLTIIGIALPKGANRVILVSFDHFASSDFNVWLQLWQVQSLTLEKGC